MKVKVVKQAGEDLLVIEIPITMEPSSSGKTTLVATSHGYKQTDIMIDGKVVTVSVNAYIKRER